MTLSDSYVLKCYGSVLFIFTKLNVNYVLIMLDGKASFTLFLPTFFLAHRSHMLKVSYCDPMMSVVSQSILSVRPSYVCQQFHPKPLG